MAATTVGIVGLGIMGSAMAGHLRYEDVDVVGFDVDPARIEALEARGGRGVDSPAEVADATDVVLTSLPSPQALLDVVGGDDGLDAAGRGDLVVADTSTLPLATKEAARELLTNGTLLDCTISGTGAQAAKRDIAIYGSGDEHAFDRIRPAFEHVARSVHHLGPFGAGSKMKFIANHLVAIHNLAAAEALALADAAEMDLAQVVEVISDGAGTSRMLEVRGPLMVDGEYEPPTASFATLTKDIGIISDFAREMRAPSPLLGATVPYYLAAMGQGRENQDPAALFEILRDLGTVPPEDT